MEAGGDRLVDQRATGRQRRQQGVRYPTVELAAAAGRKPDLVLLPTEPYPFKERHVAEVAAGIPDAEVAIVDGQDLFWWGIRTPGAVERLATVLSR